MKPLNHDAIVVKDLEKRFGHFVAVDRISYTVGKGEIFGFLGPNGAGKTTLVKHINGLLKPTKGRVIVDDSETTKLSVASLARKVGFVFQNADHQLFSETVEQEVSFALNNFVKISYQIIINMEYHLISSLIH